VLPALDPDSIGAQPGKGDRSGKEAVRPAGGIRDWKFHAAFIEVEPIDPEATIA
jgi:hypothetical protein